MARRPGSDRGFSLVEVIVVTAIVGLLAAMVAQMIKTWATATAKMAAKARMGAVKADMARLATSVNSFAITSPTGGFPSAGPWPTDIPAKSPVPWKRPAPGFEELGWAPSESPVLLQYCVTGWATGFSISAVGDLDRDGTLELYRFWGDVGMFEGPLPYETVSPVPIP